MTPLVMEMADSWLATRAALSSQAFATAWGRDGRVWWYDVRRDTDMLGGREVTDAVVRDVKAWLVDNVVVPRREGRAPLVASVEVVDEVASLLARRAAVDEVEEYLEGLPPWDGTPRLEGALADAMGMARPEDEGGGAVAAHERRWLRRWMVSAVARALSPGCQADSALVLVGNQGLGKSSALKALFGPQHVHDSSVDIEGKDGAAVMGGAWCVELAELASIRRARDVEAVKHFLTLREDVYRPPYGRRVVRRPRRGVVAGTTNDATPLTDSTGHRRFWPVRVVYPVDAAWLRTYRDAAWAEAVAAFRAGEPWHLRDDEAAAHREVAEGYAQGDEWVESLRSWVESLMPGEPVRLQAAAQQVGVDEGRLDMQTQRRLSVCLRALGLQRVHTREGKRWVRPAAPGSA